MPSIGENLKTFLTVDTTTLSSAHRVSQNKVPQHIENQFPRIWFTRSDRFDYTDLDGTKGGMVLSTFDLECISDDVDQALDLADAVYEVLHAYRGSFGAGTVKGCFVDSQDDDYVPKGIGDDEGLHVAAQSLRIFHTT